jgi:hypothetical protein
VRGLTLWQPWAQGIACRLKRMETRSWRTDYRGPLLIHAAKSRYQVADHARLVHAARAALGTGAAGVLRFEMNPPLGCAVALVNLTDCVPIGRHHGPLDLEHYFGDYTLGRWAWHLMDCRPLPEPIPCPGARGLWNVPEELQRRVLAALDAQGVGRA